MVLGLRVRAEEDDAVIRSPVRDGQTQEVRVEIDHPGHVLDEKADVTETSDFWHGAFLLNFENLYDLTNNNA